LPSLFISYFFLKPSDSLPFRKRSRRKTELVRSRLRLCGNRFMCGLLVVENSLRPGSGKKILLI
jgi:hypothetical protein